MCCSDASLLGFCRGCGVAGVQKTFLFKFNRGALELLHAAATLHAMPLASSSSRQRCYQQAFTSAAKVYASPRDAYKCQCRCVTRVPIR
jgi:hypothetical protein